MNYFARKCTTRLWCRCFSSWEGNNGVAMRNCASKRYCTDRLDRARQGLASFPTYDLSVQSLDGSCVPLKRKIKKVTSARDPARLRSDLAAFMNALSRGGGSSLVSTEICDEALGQMTVELSRRVSDITTACDAILPQEERQLPECVQRRMQHVSIPRVGFNPDAISWFNRQLAL